MNIITVLPHEGYMNQVIKDVREVYKEDTKNKICYVTLNKPHTSFFEALNADNAELNRFYVIDGITKSVIKDPKGPANCTFVNTPLDFEQIFNKVDELLNKNEYGAVVFDSVCSLFSHGEKVEVMNFLKRLSVRVSLANCEGVFVAMKNNIAPDVLEELNIFADKIIRMDNT